MHTNGQLMRDPGRDWEVEELRLRSTKPQPAGLSASEAALGDREKMGQHGRADTCQLPHCTPPLPSHSPSFTPALSHSPSPPCPTFYHSCTHFSVPAPPLGSFSRFPSLPDSRGSPLLPIGLHCLVLMFPWFVPSSRAETLSFA